MEELRLAAQTTGLGIDHVGQVSTCRPSPAGTARQVETCPARTKVRDGSRSWQLRRSSAANPARYNRLFAFRPAESLILIAEPARERRLDRRPHAPHRSL